MVGLALTHLSHRIAHEALVGGRQVQACRGSGQPTQVPGQGIRGTLFHLEGLEDAVADRKAVVHHCDHALL
jgi:hypothetical protein